MNHVFTQTDATSVRADGDAKLGGHQEHTNNFADTSKATRVDLADVDGLGLEELFEHHSVVCVFSSRNADTIGLQRLADSGVSEDVIRRSGLFNEPVRDEINKHASIDHIMLPYHGLMSASPLT